MDVEKLLDLICCPSCMAKLLFDAQVLKCTACDYTAPIVDGIPNLGKHDQFYFDEIPQDIMESILNNSECTSIEKVFSDTCSKINNPWAFKNAFDQTRDIVQYLCNVDSDSIVLDFGCGWGVISRSLAEKAKLVIAADLTQLRLCFLERLRSQNGITNLICIRAGDTDNIPFMASKFDIIILNGVLEWIPETWEGKPRNVQKEFLSKILKLLKPNGQLFIGIENRFGHRYLRGYREDHTGLRFGAVLPRFVSNMYSQLVRGKHYRTYTYGKHGYMKLLKEAGFKGVRMYGCEPSYRAPKKIFDMSSNRGARFFFSEQEGRPVIVLARRLLSCLKSSRLVAPSFMIVASNNNNTSSALERLSNRYLNNAVEIDWSSLALTGVLLSRCHNGTESFFLRVGITKNGCHRVKRNWSSINQFSKAQSHIKDYVPKPLFRHFTNGHVITAEKAIDGSQLTLAMLTSRKRQAKMLVESIRRVLSHIAEGGRDATVLDWNSKVDNIMSSILPIMNDSVKNHSLLVDWLKEGFPKERLKMGVVHGDFIIRNIICDPQKGVIAGVVDWDLALERDFCFIDWLAFDIDYYCNKMKNDEFKWVAHLLKRAFYSKASRVPWFSVISPFAPSAQMLVMYALSRLAAFSPFWDPKDISKRVNLIVDKVMPHLSSFCYKA